MSQLLSIHTETTKPVATAPTEEKEEKPEEN